MGAVKRLVPEKKTIGSGVKQLLIAVAGTLSDGKRDRAVRKFGADRMNDVSQNGIGKMSVFSALEDKCTEAEFISAAAAVQNGRFRQPVAVNIGIASADSAIEAVFFTVVCKFDQPTDKDAVLIMHLPDMTRTFTEIRGVFGRKIFEKPDPVFSRERLFLFQTVDELFHRCVTPSFSDVFSCVSSCAFFGAVLCVSVSVFSAGISGVFA